MKEGGHMKQYAVADYITAPELKHIRQKLSLTQTQFAQLVHVSKKTVERWESEKGIITGPIVTLIKILSEHPQLETALRIPEKKYPLRICYMLQQEICSIIDVDEQSRRVSVYNYTSNPLNRAFGREEYPTFEQYEEFLESRCFPKSRDKMKWILRDLELPFYDPLMIIEKTNGRMAEDEFWLQIER